MNERPAGGRSAGAMLRSAREKQGLHIAALAAAIKVAPRKLEALENDRHGELPDATFIRALAQTVCRTLKIDAGPVLELLPPAAAVTLDPRSGGLNAPFRERPGREEPGLTLATVRPLIWAASLLLVGAVVVHFWPAGLGQIKGLLPQWQSQSPTAASQPRAALPVASAPAAVMPVPGPLVERSASAALEGVVPAVAGATETPSAVVAPPAMATLPQPPQPPQTDPAASPAAGTPAGLLQLRSTAATWVQVRDARGQLLFSRTVVPGENVGLDGNLPMRLIIGNAAATQIGFRGRAVDLAPSTRDNIARLELP